MLIINKNRIINESINLLSKKYSISKDSIKYKIHSEIDEKNIILIDISFENICDKIILANKSNGYVYLFYPFFIPADLSKIIKRYKRYNKKTSNTSFYDFIEYQGDEDYFIIQ